MKLCVFSSKTERKKEYKLIPVIRPIILQKQCFNIICSMNEFKFVHKLYCGSAKPSFFKIQSGISMTFGQINKQADATSHCSFKC
jgi:hypothetical protein